MRADELYLKANVVIEPTVDRWYAWSHLIPPATLGLNHLRRHLPIMDSYVTAPQVHARALQDPLMLGGPFLDQGGERVEDVTALATNIRGARAGLLDFAAALQDLSTLLRTRATGYSLDDLYAEIPRPLRGYVEIFYDLEHRANFRLFEPLLYASRYYDTSSQGIALFETAGDERAFVLSTPSLDAPDRLHLDLAFAAEQVDALAELKWRPRSLTAVRDLLDLDDQQAALMRSFLTTTLPPRTSPPDAEVSRWRYFGHACVIVESGGVSVMTDPLIAYTQDSAVQRFTFYDLPGRIDCVLITHGHQDHTMLETLLQLRHRIGMIAVPRSNGGSLQDPSLKLLLTRLGFANVIEVQELDEIDLGPLVVRAVPFMGEHSDLDIRAKMTYIVEAGDSRLYFGADTCNIEPPVYERVREIVGEIDTIFLGMECDGAPLDWLYGPLISAPRTPESRRMEQSRRLSGSDCAKATELVRSLGGSRAYVYSMGQEPWLRYLLALEHQPDSPPIVESDKLVSWCRDAGIASERLFGCKEVSLK